MLLNCSPHIRAAHIPRADSVISQKCKTKYGITSTCNDNYCYVYIRQFKKLAIDCPAFFWVLSLVGNDVTYTCFCSGEYK